MATFNNYKSTTIRGNFNNSDYPDGSLLASGTFDRNLNVKGTLILGNEISSMDASGNIIYNDTFGLSFKNNGTNINLTKTDLLQLKNTLVTSNSITKSTIGLGNVSNLSPNDLPISSATLTALDLKANINNPTFTGTVSGITKNMVGLGNVSNLSPNDLPISSATLTALDLKANKSDIALNLQSLTNFTSSTAQEASSSQETSSFLTLTLNSSISPYGAINNQIINIGFPIALKSVAFKQYGNFSTSGYSISNITCNITKNGSPFLNNVSTTCSLRYSSSLDVNIGNSSTNSTGIQYFGMCILQFLTNITSSTDTYTITATPTIINTSNINSTVLINSSYNAATNLGGTYTPLTSSKNDYSIAYYNFPLISLAVIGNSSFTNVSINELIVNNNTSLNSLLVQNASTLNSLTVNNNSTLNNLTVNNNSTLNSLTVQNTSSLNTINVNTINNNSADINIRNNIIVYNNYVNVLNPLIYQDLTAGYYIDGASSGNKVLYPIVCSINRIVIDIDDAWIVKAGFKFVLYDGVNYSSLLGTIDNTSGLTPLAIQSTSIYSTTNRIASVKVYYNNNEVTYLSGYLS